MRELLSDLNIYAWPAN